MSGALWISALALALGWPLVIAVDRFAGRRDARVGRSAYVVFLLAALAFPFTRGVLAPGPLLEAPTSVVRLAPGPSGEAAARPPARTRAAPLSLPSAVRAPPGTGLARRGYLAGVVVALALLLAAVARAWSLGRSGRDVTEEFWRSAAGGGGLSAAADAPGWGNLTARETEAVRAPVLAGVLRPRLIMPADWRDAPPDALGDAALHELAHLRRRDPLLRLVSRLARALYWFHPAVWHATRALDASSEAAADAWVVARGRDPRGYVGSLLYWSRRRSTGPLATLAMARGRLTSRVDRILAGHPARVRPGLAAGGAAAAFVALSALLGGTDHRLHLTDAAATPRVADWDADVGSVLIGWADGTQVHPASGVGAPVELSPGGSLEIVVRTPAGVDRWHMRRAGTAPTSIEWVTPRRRAQLAAGAPVLHSVFTDMLRRTPVGIEHKLAEAGSPATVKGVLADFRDQGVLLQFARRFLADDAVDAPTTSAFLYDVGDRIQAREQFAALLEDVPARLRSEPEVREQVLSSLDCFGSVEIAGRVYRTLSGWEWTPAELDTLRTWAASHSLTASS